MVKRAKSHRDAKEPLVRFAKAFRQLRITLSRNRFPEAATAQYFGLPRFIGGAVVCVLYIINTYMQGIPPHYYFFQCIYGVAIAINLLVSFIYADRPVYFAFSLKTIVECLSIPSLLLSSGATWLNFNFLQAYCILMEWGTLEKHDIVLRNYSTMSRLLVNLFLQLLTFLFVTSCGVQFFELLGDPGQALRSETFEITWANAVYFAVVTLMTVGYGDFVPYTLFGRMWIVMHIIFAAYLVSREISLLIDALKSMRRGGGSYVNSSGTDHVVVTGRIKWEFLQQFVKEFLAESSNLDTKVIVLASNPTWSEDDWNKFVAHDQFYDYHLIFLEGSALRIDDLSRANVGTAKGVFVLADPHVRDPYKEDSDILKAILTIRNYSGTVPIYTLNALYESSFQFGIAMDHLEPIAAEQLMGYPSPFPYFRTFTGLPQTPTMAEGEEYLRMDGGERQGQRSRGVLGGARSPEYRSIAPDLGPGESSVLGEEASNLYSMEERNAGAANSIDGNSIQGAPIAAPEKYFRSKYNGQELKSENLCMQELEMVVLAENVFCNGLSTLIANATLRVAPQPSRNDSPWLMEYKLGAECSILQFKIPRKLNGMRFGSVATVLQDYGLVLLAIRGHSENDWVLLTVNTILEENSFAMVLSYHDHSVIRKIAEHAANFIWNEEQCRRRNDSRNAKNPIVGPAHSLEIESSERKSDLDSFYGGHGDRSEFGKDGGKHGTAFVPMASHRKVARAGLATQYDNPARSQDDDNSAVEVKAQRSKAPPRNMLTRSNSTSTARDLRKQKTSDDGKSNSQEAKGGKRSGSQSADGKRSRNASSDPPKGSKKLIYNSMDKLPAALRGHIIICLDGESPLISLEVLLRRIWMQRSGQKKKVPVVVIHPRFPKNFGRQIGGYQGSLFLLQGNSLSLDTLKQAQYQSARAFLIMASESSDDSGGASTDSKAIFTLMTLDSLLADTFVCCVLDAEESLQLLRAPRQARRVDVKLGEHREPDMIILERSPMATGLPRRSASSTSLMQSLPPTHFTSALGRSARHGTFRPLVSARTAGHAAQKRLELSNRSNLKGITRSNSMRFVHNDSSDDEDQPRSDIHNLRDQHHMQERSREEYYERQRYASGEMMISSLFTALLTREHTDPGYIRFIRQLIGAASGSNGCWVRQVDIPDSWTQVEKAIDGRTFRETSIKLLQYGCIALGLYRSGDAPVRVETKSEQWERRVSNIKYLGEEEIRALQSDADQLTLAARMMTYGSYIDRKTGRAAGHLTQGSGTFPDAGMPPHNLPFNELLLSRVDDTDEFDRTNYICPSTKRQIFFQEAVNGENVLPYVYCCPEPYSLVASSDAVFVLCDPSTMIPSDWGDD